METKNLSKGIRRCLACKSSFVPLFSDKELYYLYNDEEAIEYAEENPTYASILSFGLKVHHPKQLLCANCAIQPDIVATGGTYNTITGFSPVKFEKVKKTKKRKS